ncbi:hypothetical protein OQA88_736 [Cercophora sp. LCS_1]
MTKLMNLIPFLRPKQPSRGPYHDLTNLDISLSLSDLSSNTTPLSSPSHSTSILTPASTSASTPTTETKRPILRRYLSHFTLGFADGLTVPFALSAGLSALGSANLVVTAGIAEIVGGSISMGMGGYFSADGERRSKRALAQSRAEKTQPDIENTLSSQPLQSEDDTALVRDYLAPLDLECALLQRVLESTSLNPAAAARLREKHVDEADEGGHPVVVGLAVALGYVLGGCLPLLPYCFVERVGDGLAWSFAVCLVALFGFGALREGWVHGAGWRVWGWEGAKMMVLGGLAAGTAVGCVRVFVGFSGESTM